MSVNGVLSGYGIDLGLHYRLAHRLGCSATLVGSGTILAAPEAALVDDPAEVAEVVPVEEGSLLVVCDSGGRVRCWSALQGAGLWKRFVSLATASTPAEHLDYLRGRGVGVAFAGQDRVDLSEALARLGEDWGVEDIRVDAGATLNALLLRDGLVDELSLVLQPGLTLGAGGVPLTLLSEGCRGDVRLSLRDVERFDAGEVWLHYDVLR
jgi:2,5-diamino-6-(ribosylamino)-4(3H)-pyrimidinone 5'-phosphate reductase